MKMKKSTAYYMAQIAILESNSIDKDVKLEILRVLLDAEDVASYTEKTASAKE